MAEFMWIHLSLYLDFSRAYPQTGLTCWSKENSGYEPYNIHSRKKKVNSYPKLLIGQKNSS